MTEEKKENKPAQIPEAQAPKAQAPEVQAPKVEAPKVETPQAEAPKADAAAAEPAEAKKAEEKKIVKAVNCAVCNKSIKKKRYYYRNGKYFCTKRCWKTTAKKEEKATQAQAPSDVKDTSPSK